MASAGSQLQNDEHRGYRHPFITDGMRYLGGLGELPRTLSELAMCYLSAEIRLQKNWWLRYNDQTFIQYWMHESLSRFWSIHVPSNTISVSLTDKQIDYVLDELEGYAALRDEKRNCQVSCFERIWESGSLLDHSRTHALNQQLSTLEELSVCQSSRSEDGVTIPLVDPFLHCLVYNKTQVRDMFDPCNFRPWEAPPLPEIYTLSQRYAFLPTDFSVSMAGKVEAVSYINNINPRHKSLYATIENILSSLIPLFEHVLTDLHRNNPFPQRIKGSYRYTEWNEPEPPEFSDDEDGWVTYEKEHARWTTQRPIKLPDVPSDGYTGGLEYRKHVVELSGKTVQIITSISEVRLQPDGPEYPGSDWHVEGMKNERIVACAYYYSSVENIEGNFLEFRMAVTSPRGFFAGDAGAVLRTWGFQDGAAQMQNIGSVPIRPGLAIAFPNIYQSRTTPFRLADPTKEGHQTVLAFFLVDPDIKPIISTTRVVPQQESWIRQTVEESMDPRFPVELIEKILEYIETSMTLDEAERFRREMLQERKIFGTLNNSYHFCIPFDVWNEMD